jgi:predicted nucleic acid-binding protein
MLFVADSSILISYLRYGKYENFLFKNLSRMNLFLPGPVLGELYAGANTKDDLRDLESFRRALGENVTETTVEDWILAGRCIVLYSMRFGKVKPRDHIIDVLIAITAAKIRAVLATENLRHMKMWKEILIKLGKKIKVETPDV